MSELRDGIRAALIAAAKEWIQRTGNQITFDRSLAPGEIALVDAETDAVLTVLRDLGYAL